jgi:hypothetical protein
MRKSVALKSVSLDCGTEALEEWAFSYANDEMEQENAAGMATSDAMVLGRVICESRPANEKGKESR